MAKGKLRTCYVCGTQYNYCPRCSDDPKWKFVYCCENCRDINYTIDKYKAGVATADEANDIMSNLDLSKVKDDYFKGYIEEIRDKSTPKKSNKAKAKSDYTDAKFSDSE